MTPPRGNAGKIAHYIIIRRDLPLGPMAAQITHAAGNSSPGGLRDDTIAVVLGVADEAELERVALKLEASKAAFVRVIETDAPYTNQLMALGCVPGEKREVGRPLRGLRRLE